MTEEDEQQADHQDEASPRRAHSPYGAWNQAAPITEHVDCDVFRERWCEPLQPLANVMDELARISST